jgi:hypothetical protein
MPELLLEGLIKVLTGGGRSMGIKGDESNKALFHNLLFVKRA